MIISRIYEGQGLGNQLWCLTTAYALSLKKKFKFTPLDPTNSFLGNNIFDLPKNFFNYSPKINFQYYEKCFFEVNNKDYLYDYDPDILKIKNYTEIIGNFQSEKYFFKKDKQIKSLFKISSKTKKLSQQFKKFNILNIRGGEYKRHKNLLLPDSYWKSIYKIFLSKNEFQTICVTDDYNYAKRIFPKLDIISDDIQLCFSAIMGSKNIGLSNSSFSYFPIFFGSNKSDIIAPYQWSRFNNSMNLWYSPCNYYKGWRWLDINNNFQSKKKCFENIELTRKYLQKKGLKSKISIPIKQNILIVMFKIFVKKILGLFNWRYR